MEVQVVFSQQLRRFSRWLRNDIAANDIAANDIAANGIPDNGIAGRDIEANDIAAKRVPPCASPRASSSVRTAINRSTGRNSQGGPRTRPSALRANRARVQRRSVRLEQMEQRLAMTASPIWVGGVFIEEDLGTDLQGDSFYITFLGGAEGTQLKRLVIDGDMYEPGFGRGDIIFDTIESGLGADHAFPFQITRLITANPNATVTATVADGSSRLVLDFTNFFAGDTLIFSIDVDEVQIFDPNERDLDEINEGIDPITSGVEFQGTMFQAQFIAPHYEDIVGQSNFMNRYDAMLAPSGLQLPEDNIDGKRDRTAGTAFSVTQVPKPISLGGIVYVDNNYSLTLDAGEQRLANVQLELYRQVDGIFVSTGFKTVTDSQGAYSFGTNLKLMPGIYQVRETQPAGYLSVGATTGVLNNGVKVGQLVSGNPDWLTQIEIPLGDLHATQLNFAEAQPASIAGQVTVVRNGFDCADANGIHEPIAGVTIELLNSSGVVVATTTTDANGNYQFANLRAGNYTVRELQPAGYLEGSAQVGTISNRVVGQLINGSLISSITINGGNQGLNYDFCELLPSEISGHVYVDRNDNGVREIGEAPIAGVTLILWNASGAEIGRTVTDAGGFYRFDNIIPGIYRITEQQPAGFLPGKATAGTINSQRVGTTDATGNVITQVAVPSGVKGINYDFGEILPGSIAGRVIVDTNANCIIDAVGEMPLPGVRIELLDKAGLIVSTTFTDADGYYKFDSLRPGEYTVRQTQPAGYFQGGQYAGSGGGNDALEDIISQIIVNPGDHLIDYLFCEIPPAELSGFVFVDRDADCIFDSDEAPIAGVSITLYDANGTALSTTTTDANGRYHFGNLRPGTYTVRQEQPLGYLQGGQKAGSAGGNDSVADVISAIFAGAGQILTDYNFCEVLPASIHGQVFVDLDFDCIRDENEEPLAGVRIELLNQNGQVIATTFTDANGQYSFVGLRPGTYSVRETQPVGYFQGGSIAPATGGDTSLEDIISQLVLGSGDVLRDANFCEVPPAKISGYVFQDGGPILTADIDSLDLSSVRDGQRKADDKPIGNVRLQLRTIAGAPIDSSRALSGFYSTQYIEVLTDANGYFEFDGLRAGSYHIYQVQPEGYHDGLDTPGSTGGFSINRGQQQSSPQFELLMQSLTMDAATNPGFDAILMVTIEPNQHSYENNFSEVIAVKPPEPPNPAPPIERPRPPNDPVNTRPETFFTQPPLLWWGTPWSPEEPLIGIALQAPPSWHLSVINAGFPRGKRSGQPATDQQIAAQAELLDLYAWSVDGMMETRWSIVSTTGQAAKGSRIAFHIPGGKPLAGDFNGDGVDELAFFVDGEWFIDLNGNGEWDEDDIWIKMGSKGDQPVVGDWDGDGKDDVGIFGRRWSGDERAIAAEPGLPDPENRRRVKPKNLPPVKEEAPDDPRWMKRGQRSSPGRADLIDHVFRFGSEKDIAVSGDFNGDGIASIGVFQNGLWTLDVDGDGRFTDGVDKRIQFGDVGDIPLVGDFDGDGIDEIAIVRGRQVLVDSNMNGRIDATDQVFILDDVGDVVVGDFDGDGMDEPALLKAATGPMLEAKSSMTIPRT